MRVITFFTGADLPVFLLTAFAQSERVNLTKAERNGLKTLTESIAEADRSRGIGEPS